MKLYDDLRVLIDNAQTIVIIQADNPDGDSLASSLALEHILGDMGKEPYLYCGVDIPDYLKHIQGWDRVNKEIPNQFDASVIVDTSALVLLEKLESSHYRNAIASKPVIVIDHHANVKCDIPYATVVLNDGGAVATGEAIYKLASELKWPLSLPAKTHIASSILADSLGLTSDGTTAGTYRIMADLIESGVERPVLEDARRALTKMPKPIFYYKARLIERATFEANGRIALVVIPHDEIMEYSPLYNPAPLIQTDLLQTEGVLVAIVFKIYKDGKITGSVRTNNGGAIAGELAKHFGGGGHVYASGFKITNGRTFEDIKSECIQLAGELLDKQSGS
ncbi:MAG TPA: DHH family phosphoesterase [Candidatus Limnocylindrales bacterium]|nr:DHH family phosphoesterase [Candidatus Limnocylindrales bacterium]